MNLRRLSGTQLFAVAVAVVVVVVIVYLISTDAFELGGDDEADRLALPDAPSEMSETDAGEPVSAGPDAEAPAAAATTTASAGAAVLDQPFQFGDLRIAVTSLRLSSTVSEGVDEVAAVDRFATVHLTVRNTGRSPLSLTDALFLMDGTGRTFTPNPMATAAAARRNDQRGDALVVPLQPGITTDLVVVFDVPEEAENLRLRITGGFIDVTLDQ